MGQLRTGTASRRICAEGMVAEMTADTVADMTDTTAITLTFDDLFVLTTGDAEAFVYDMVDSAAPPPYYITVADRRFALAGLTFLEHGHGAVLPRWVREEEAAGHLVMFVRREERLIGYVHDPAAIEDEDEAEGE